MLFQAVVRPKCMSTVRQFPLLTACSKDRVTPTFSTIHSSVFFAVQDTWSMCLTHKLLLKESIAWAHSFPRPWFYLHFPSLKSNFHNHAKPLNNSVLSLFTMSVQHEYKQCQQHTCIRDESDGLKSTTKTRRYWSAINVTSVSGARKKEGGLAKCSRSESTSSGGTHDNTSNSSSLLFQNRPKNTIVTTSIQNY